MKRLALLCCLLWASVWPAVAGQRRSYTTNEGLAHNSVQGFCMDASGLLWICNWYGLERFDGYQFHSFRPDAELGVNSRFKAAYLHQAARQIIVRTLSGEYLSFSLDDYTYRRCSEELAAQAVRFQHELTDPYGNRWEEASMGVDFIPHPPVGYHLVTHPTYPYARAFFEDQHGRLWIAWGTSFGRSKGEVVIYDRSRGCETVIHTGSAVYAIMEDRSNNIWLGTRNEGVVVLKPTADGGFTRYCYPPDATEVRPNAVFHLNEDRSGRVWIATLGGGLYVVEAGYAVERLRFSTPANYPVEQHPRTRSLLDVGDDLFVGSDNGLLRAKADVPSDEMRFENLLQPSLTAQPAHELIHLAQSRKGEVLISSFGRGIYAFDPSEERFYAYAADQIADKEAVYSMLETPEEDLWVVTQTELLLYDTTRKEAIRPMQEPRTLIETRPFRDQQGRYWFATTEGALCVPKHPSRLVDSVQTTVYFSEWVCHRGEQSISRLLPSATQTLVIQPDERNISLRVSALRYGECERIRYAWRLSGTQSADWVEVERGNEVVLPDLQAGVWQLEVRSTDGSGRWLNNAGVMQLQVIPLWYERGVAKAVVVLVVLLVVGSIGWLLLRVKRLRGMYEALLNSPMVVSVQTAMTEIKPEESLTDADRQFIDALNELIGAQIGEEQISIDALAQALHMSRSVFYRRLKSVVGQSPVEYLKEFRLQYAIELLDREQEKPVAAIAYACGFSSPQYFNNVFRKRYHMTPNEWRRRKMNKNE